MKKTILSILLVTSVILVTGCCSTGCDGGWGNNFSSVSYSKGSCASSCCGSGSW